VILEGVFTFKFIVVGDLKVAVVAFAVKLNEFIVAATTAYLIIINPEPPVPPIFAEPP
jgi:hypothetical protein